ncbi:serine hydrolase domain-containing protein [Pelomonas sp. SE-A7]|uniref:serine hydrolase domain-containing protein n=1 Tax=Pelomonas sp. SE-A7 TaxID=3054953 RepID=UPI00259C97F1|nr:serine hydrolase domain-containing protein [Pelomonas sp. SE-A7]MDM4768168.1 serine hydrolase domain-containing protein [Pelomonas sp. SE-A7]
MSRRPLATLLSALILAGCAIPPPAPPLQREALVQADTAIEAMIAAEQMPGGQFWVEREGQSYHRAYGRRALLPTPEASDEATVYDAASLTKVVVTTPLVQLLREQGLLDLEAPLQRYLPGCGGEAWGAITLRHLLTHTAGLPAGMSAKRADGEFWTGKDGALQQACSQPLKAAPGTEFRYSDISFILLGLIVERVGGAPLDQQARQRLFAPLGMQDSGYLPLQRLQAGRIAPTEILEGGQVLRGEVHDPTARRMGGVAGHAGLFTTSSDLARYARMLLAGGKLPDGRRFLTAESIRLLSEPQSPPGLKELRTAGFDMDTPYSRPRGSLYPKSSYGHTGFTGCILWIDPTSRSFYVLLANRVHPGKPTNILPLYGQLGTLAARATGVAEAQSR